MKENGQSYSMLVKTEQSTYLQWIHSVVQKYGGEVWLHFFTLQPLLQDLVSTHSLLKDKDRLLTMNKHSERSNDAFTFNLKNKNVFLFIYVTNLYECVPCWERYHEEKPYVFFQ